MPNIKSAKKRVKVTKSKTLKNQMFDSALRTMIKKFEKAVVDGDKETARVIFKDAVSKVDKAVAKGRMHRNTAARKKSQFAIKLNALVK